jgi:SAM-dependent methyltransferase
MADNRESEDYAHGYDSALALRIHANRTAEKQAFWFLPYLKSGMTLLDCGCATGSITVGLAKHVEPGQVIGIDISEIEIERAHRRASAAGLANIRFVVGDIYQIDFPDNSFDAIFSHNVLEHIGEPDRALREIHRVLKPGGIIGIRDVDWGGCLQAPDNDLIEKSLAIIEADWEGVNGHPRLGRYLGGKLNEAGFINITTSASYETYSDLEGRSLFGEIIAGRFTEKDFVERVINKRGVTNFDELESIKEAWLNWKELPDAFHAHAHCEAIGWKAIGSS